MGWIVGVGTIFALSSGCGGGCEDGDQSEECVGASATESSTSTSTSTSTTSSSSESTSTSTSTTTIGGSESDSESDSGTPTSFCKDADMDGQGDPNDCIPADGDAPPGYVPNADDCDDTDANTHVGAAELEDPAACMTDADGDGWGETEPKPGVTPGTDCDDTNEFAFPGAAELEDAAACMEDADGDGWGDAAPPAGVTPGTDCKDDDVSTYPGAGELEDASACMTDADNDGFGDVDPAPGATPGSDCDDASPTTFPGAAPKDDPVACMKDDDDDDFGDVDPPAGVTPGTDCDDTNEFTYPGAAFEESLEACKRDVDGDGYGDDSPPDGVTPGIDCNDTDPQTFEMCADCEPNEKFCAGAVLNVCNQSGNGSKIVEECAFGCDDVNKVCYEELTVDAGPSLCIDPGGTAQLNADAEGGDGAYMYSWTPPMTLDDPMGQSPTAQPSIATTYTVEVTDGQGSMASDAVSVFIKNQTLALSDVECKIRNFKWAANQPAPNWVWNANLVELCQNANSGGTARFCGWPLNNANIQGKFQVKTSGDDDYIGFFWGVQPFDVLTEEPRQFYFLSWKQGNQVPFCGANSGQAGLLVKRVDIKDPVNAPMTCQDLHAAVDTPNSVVLATPGNWTTQGWLDNIQYVFDLTHTPKEFTVRILRADNNQVIAERNFEDETFPSGQVGFYSYSQAASCFSGFKSSCL